jgi:hypothetical protein
MSNTRKWPDIGAFHNVMKSRAFEKGIITYRSKIKLDGTNAAVRFENGVLQGFQSRTRDISPGDDNYGFASWASQVSWPEVPFIESHPVTVIHGEWAGPGIQKGTSVSRIPEKSFFIFAIEFSTNEIDENTGSWKNSFFETNPDIIQAWLGDMSSNNIHVLPWFSDPITINLNNDTQVKNWVDSINDLIQKIETCDPYINDLFGVEGLGEGLVFYPVSLPFSKERNAWKNFAFKAKGEKHRVKNTNKSVEINPQILLGVQDFVNSFVTEQRCLQGLNIVLNGDTLSSSYIGPFIAWVSKDIKKESQVELDESGMDWKQVCGAVSRAAQRWIISRLNSY